MSLSLNACAGLACGLRVCHTSGPDSWILRKRSMREPPTGIMARISICDSPCCSSCITIPSDCCHSVPP
ncbi:hypothetical protein PR003_g17962 [Phytophthora rubi]|uniref:Uncharacterized protein n=2 Tax=Phytophthora TaxID=4783 RepID=A0A6A3GLZ6_9STRA|nr:hypothetical protein PR002_g30858 [Phytophthora rubi]KAE9009048.1 hypothetical protein PR001_g16545 [Phytophthora rubi]KAE9302958.1 hypothetical protein PF008_g22353 [Phytophthora fragariae]KAE9319445.1 hypothetical protein PR003_g17962 [Phytophthora rubi]